MPGPDAKPATQPDGKDVQGDDVASSARPSRYRYGAFGDDTTGTSLARKAPVVDSTLQTALRPGK
jgi:hypothetical protein